MTDIAHNLIVLQEAQRAIEEFEKTIGISSAEMLCAAQDDPRLVNLGSFELMDWHFAIDQRDAIKRLQDCAAPPESRNFSISFRYRVASTVAPVNVTERELDLAA